MIKSIVIPASVKSISGSAFACSGIRSIWIEDGNQHFCVSGDFLLDITRTSLILFFGTAATVIIDPEIQVLCDSCFYGCETISRLHFEAGSQLHRIERCAFANCSSLHTICIPSSIESLDREWFLFCHFNGNVVFDIVQFESAESLAKMVIGDSADLSGGFEIEVLNWNEEIVIPGYCVEVKLSCNLIRLKKEDHSLTQT
jgi:hypothetical protein